MKWVLPAMPRIAPFAQAQTVCFFGDSITRRGLYQAYLRLFYAVHHPALNIKWVNCGRSGGQLTDGLRRLEWDVLVHRPDVLVVAFGMNDVGSGFDMTSPADGSVSERLKTNLHAARANLRQLLDRVKSVIKRVIILGPSIYDENERLTSPCDRGKNAALRLWTQELSSIAAEHGCDFVDLHTPLERLSEQLRIRNPEAKLVGDDRIHPGPLGHYLIASLIRQSQLGNDEPQFEIVPDRSLLSGCCRLRADALPLPIPLDVQCEAEAVHLELASPSKRWLGFPRWQQGSYRLCIDHKPITVLSADTMIAGVDLAKLPMSPLHDDALKLMKLVIDRHLLEADHARAFAWVAEHALRPEGVNQADRDAIVRSVKRYLETDLIDFARRTAECALADLLSGRDINSELAAADAEIHSFVQSRSYLVGVTRAVGSAVAV